MGERCERVEFIFNARGSVLIWKNERKKVGNNFRVGDGFVIEENSSLIEVVVESIGDKKPGGEREVLISIRNSESYRQERTDNLNRAVKLREGVYFVVSGRNGGRERGGLREGGRVGEGRGIGGEGGGERLLWNFMLLRVMRLGRLSGNGLF
ncbi:MAG: hypothetical protein ABIG28_02205 [archaeon]